MSGPSVYLSWPTTFNPFPDSLPRALPPPIKERSFRAPFGIEKNLFNFALRPEVPLIFATTYILAVFSLNAYNRKRKWQPWAISKTSAFKYFVVLHNVLLALYSFATFAAMLRAIAHTWPGIENANGAAGVADALCKLHGPRGLGDAATFNTTINIWEVKNTAIHVGRDSNPDPTDVGRLWNEGLAFWGWIFYVSKFYEVVDTLIILAKGKRSATLQTYHHAGAMLCMWSGIRYMSPPIWMFVFINSAIHGMMYTYFTLSALGYRVPQGLKRGLTTMQIAQFLFGASYAAAHLFVQYDIPISTPYQVASTIKEAVSSVSSAAASATSGISSAIESPVAAATMGAFVRKMLLRAAGEEGVAERVHMKGSQQLLSPKIEEKIQEFNERTTYETRYHTEWTKVDCIDTSGEAFAIYLNLLYLAPLTFLFMRFFFRAYTQMGKARRPSQIAQQARDAGKQATRDTEQYAEKRGEKAEGAMAKRGSEAAEKVRKETQDIQEQLKQDVKNFKEGKFFGERRVSDQVAGWENKVKGAKDKVTKEGQKLVNGSANSTPRKGSPAKKQSESAIEDDAEHKEASKGAPKEADSKSKSKPKGQKEQPKQPEKGPELGSGANNDSEEKQDANLETSEAVREGAGGTEAAGREDKENKPPTQQSTTSTENEPEAKQDENLDESKAVRPGASTEEPASPENSKYEDDTTNTDAMGQSGSIIDLSKEKAKEAADKAEKAPKGAASS